MFQMADEDERRAQLAEVDDTVPYDPEELLDENDLRLRFMSELLFREEIGTIEFSEWECGRYGPNSEDTTIIL